MQRSNKLRLTEVNQHLVCFLCGGYFIDATTIVECLHSFCRSCLIKYLESNSFCPICEVQIHKAKPFLNIKPDKALQDIVYKLVPGLFHSEMRRRREFYAKHPEYLHETTPEGRGVGVERLIYSPDDSISLSLEYLDGEDMDFGCTSTSNRSSDGSGSGQVSQTKRYLQCPALVTIAHLKKFLRIKYELTSEHTVEVIHRREPLADDYTLMDIAYIHTWKRNGPMRFFYRIYHTSKDASSTTEEMHPAPIEQISQPRKTSQPTSTVTRPTEPASTQVENNPKKLLPTPDTRQPSLTPLDTRLPMKTTPATIVPTNQVNTVTTNSTQSVAKSSPSPPKGTQPHPKNTQSPPKSVQILPKSAQQPIKSIQLSTKPVQSSSKSIQLPPKSIQPGPKNIQSSPNLMQQLPKNTQPSSKPTQSPARNTQPPIIPITVTSAQVTNVTTTVTSTLSLQPSSSAVSTQQFAKSVTKSVNSITLPLSKTSAATKTVTQSVPSNVSQVSIQLPTASAGKASMNSSATVARAPTQRQNSLTTVSKASSSRPIPTEQVRTTTNVLSQVSSTVIPSTETITKDSFQTTPTSVTKISVHSVPRQSPQSIHNDSTQSLSASPSSELERLNEQKPVEGTNNKIMPISPSTASIENPIFEVKSKEIKASEDCKTETVESTTPTPNDENKRVADIPVVANGPTNLNATKPLLAKTIQQRSQMMMARKSSQLVKTSTDSTNAKVNSLSVKNQLQINKEATKISRVNQKAVDKQGTSENPIALKKERIQLKSGINESVKKDSDNNALNTNEMQTANTTSNLVQTNNNNNVSKVPQQNQQLIRNNQQILKKNDEIMRCVNSIKRPIHIFQRKPPEVTKPYTSQPKTQDEKFNAKKRRVTTAMPVKRPLPSSVEVARQDDTQPVAKKPRPGVENNRKLNHVDQKPPQVKLKSVSNSVTSQNLQNTTIKSDASGETPTNVLKTNNSHFQVSSLIGTTEHNKSTDVKNQESNKNSVTNDKLQSNVPVQRTALNTQTVVRPKQCNTPAIMKTESSVPKPNITPPQARGSSSHVQTSQCVPFSAPVVAHSNTNSRLCPTPRPPTVKGKVSVDQGAGALDLSASPRRAHPSTILSIAQTLALRQQQKCPSPAPPPLSPLSSLSPFPVMSSVPVRSPPPQLRIPIPPHHRPAHSQQPQQRPSSLSSSSPSPPADILPGSSRMRPPQQQPDMYSSHLLPPAALMFRHQLELQRMWGAGKHNTPAGMEWFNVKRFENFMKTLQHQQQSGRSTPFYPFNNNTAAATNSHRK